MLGGGTFITQNKILPGTYINFVSLASASATLSDRGIATMPLALDWGVPGKVFEVTNEDFNANSMKLFGYSSDHEKMKGLRDLFKNIKTLYAYRLVGNTAEKAKSNDGNVVAKYPGVAGNNITLKVTTIPGDTVAHIVETYFNNVLVDSVTTTEAGVEIHNDYIDASILLNGNATITLTGGTNGTITGDEYQAYFDAIEPYSFNALGIVTTDSEINGLCANFCKRLRDEMGVKFQAVVYNHKANYEGVVNVKNKVTDANESEASLVYWVTGIVAGCAVNASNLNKLYDGEFTVDTDYTQKQLEEAIKAGEFTLHNVGFDVRVLEDINSLTETSDVKNELFKDNQTIRVIDQIANDTASIFNTKYLGGVPNDDSGRISLWADLVKHREELQSIRAIENFKDEDLKVEKGATKKSVVINEAIEIVNSMAKLYVTTTIA